MLTPSVHQSAPSADSPGKDAFLKGLGVVGEACADLFDADSRLVAWILSLGLDGEGINCGTGSLTDATKFVILGVSDSRVSSCVEVSVCAGFVSNRARNISFLSFDSLAACSFSFSSLGPFDSDEWCIGVGV
jgi:hypothetical protein